ncbi:haloacid dehalogenase type II [Antrihabitans cavernicola]|uniref:haloacid dehalogenase type II n=1 Tax=Antrihabitans cavernicola TaxID=2495913 RepID=UPI001F370F96|nr:haloacid dehalogenase type II [Spelaeibacter cavernicola]
MTTIKALLFDVQGTATDFHTPVTAAARRISAGRHPDTDWSAVVNDWRAAYFRLVDTTPVSRENWVSVHSIYRDSLDELLSDNRIGDVSAAERDELTLAWQQLIPWPDTVGGMTRLKQRYTLAALSNADVSAVINLSKLGGLPWDAVFSAEMFGAFKPDPITYRTAAQYLGLDAEQIMMVASHKYDIEAAAALGFRTAFVARPFEYGANGTADVAYDNKFDLNAADFADLATQLGC